MRAMKSVISLIAALGMLIYAVPRLEIGQGFTPPTIYGIVWIGFSLLVIAAHLHELLGVDEQTRDRLDRLNTYARWKLERRIREHLRNMQTGE
ncbi:hypothetical protein [Ferviditalea candida]|uniref:Uncharacterized protein n=1 Tax=Ferviditalea candida TaxID=3108399 RepID=A0ABU5ZFS9_9BACL|nr:hypothetical protein [Paenibacillaceae bacterium T2]